MKKYITFKQKQMKIDVEYNGEYYSCNYFFDTESGTEGIDIYDEDNEHLGEAYGINMPSEDAEYNEIENFNQLIREWLEQNNY